MLTKFRVVFLSFQTTATVQTLRKRLKTLRKRLFIFWVLNQKRSFGLYLMKNIVRPVDFSALPS